MSEGIAPLTHSFFPSTFHRVKRFELTNAIFAGRAKEGMHAVLPKGPPRGVLAIDSLAAIVAREEVQLVGRPEARAGHGGPGQLQGGQHQWQGHLVCGRVLGHQDGRADVAGRARRARLQLPLARAVAVLLLLVQGAATQTEQKKGGNQ